MQVQVLLEQVENGRFRATGSGPFTFIAEGATEEEATRNYRDEVAARLLNGGKLVAVELPDGAGTIHPWLEFAGTLPDDELTQDWRQAMADYRRENDDEHIDQP